MIVSEVFEEPQELTRPDSEMIGESFKQAVGIKVFADTPDRIYEVDLYDQQYAQPVDIYEE